jgi:hypothetical protein
MDRFFIEKRDYWAIFDEIFQEKLNNVFIYPYEFLRKNPSISAILNQLE